VTSRSQSILAAIGGVIAGYVLWLVAISIGDALTTVSRWGVVVLIGSLVLGLVALLWGRRLRGKRNFSLASFAFALPVLPVLLSIGVLADSYM
jgi:hypothetical protein